MQEFHDIRLPDFISKASSSSISFTTEISQNVSGKEIRRVVRENPMRKYIINHFACTREEYEELMNFFYCRLGSGISFKMKDYFDYQVKDYQATVEKQILIQKEYLDSCNKKIRSNILVVPETLVVMHDGQSVSCEQKSHNLFEAPFETATNVSISFEFDVIVRFNQDEILYRIDSDGAIILEKIELIEVLL